MSDQKKSNLPDVNWSFWLKLAIGIVLLILPYRYGMPYIIGFVIGMTLMTYLVLFPTPIGYMILSKLFPQAFSQFKGVQDEHEKTEQKRTVRYTKKE